MSAVQLKGNVRAEGLSPACLAMALHVAALVTRDLHVGEDASEAENMLRRSRRAGGADLAVRFVIEEWASGRESTPPAAPWIALLRALKPYAERAGAQMSFVVDTVLGAFEGKVSLDELRATRDDCFSLRKVTPPAVPAHAAMWMMTDVLSGGLSPDERDHTISELVREVAAALPDDELACLADLPARLRQKLDVVTVELRENGSAFCACPECCAPSESTCICAPEQRALRRFERATEGREVELRQLRALAACMVASSEESPIPLADDYEPVEYALRTLIRVGDTDPAIKTTLRLHGLDLEAAALAEDLAERGRDRAARAFVLAGMVLAHFMTPEDREDMERSALRILDLINGRVSRGDFEHEVDAVTGGAECCADADMLTVIGGFVVVDGTTPAAGAAWLLRDAAEKIESDARAVQAARAARDALGQCVDVGIPRDVNEDGADDLRRYFGLPTTIDLFINDQAAE